METNSPSLFVIIFGLILFSDIYYFVSASHHIPDDKLDTVSCDKFHTVSLPVEREERERRTLSIILQENKWADYQGDNTWYNTHFIVVNCEVLFFSRKC